MSMQTTITENRLKKLIGTLTQRYQVTVPAAVRRHLGVSASDQVVFVIEDEGDVRLERAEFDIDSAFGSVEPLDPSIDLDEQIRIARDEKASRDYGGAE